MPYKFNPFTGNLDIEGPIITGSGTVSAAADGTAQVPGINFANDLNTGIYRPGADQIAISTGGTGRLFITSAGVIQTAASGQIESVSSAGDLTLYGGSTNKGGGIRLGGGNADADVRFYAQAYSSTPAERMRITGGGNVGIGTSSPGTKLVVKVPDGFTTVANTFSVLGANSTGFYVGTHHGGGSSGCDLVSRGYATTQGDFVFTSMNGSYLNPVERMRIDTNGNVGINTAAPTTALHVEKSGAGIVATFRTKSATDGSVIGLVNGGEAVGYLGDGSSIGTGDTVNTNFALRATQSRNITFVTGATPTEKVRITNAGNVGIGTSAPLAKLEVRDTQNTQIKVVKTGVAYTEIGVDSVNYLDYGNQPLAFRFTTNEVARFDTSGNFGIGNTNPLSILTAGTGSGTNAITINGVNSSSSVNQLVFAGGGSNNPSAAIEYNAADPALAFQVGNYSTLGSSERMRIDSSGRLLVGTTSAGSVSGTIFAQGNSSAATGPAVINISRGSSPTGAGVQLGVLSYSFNQNESIASIQALRDAGTWSGTSLPTRLEFSTTADGAATPTERMRVTSDGYVRLAGGGIQFNGDTAAANALDDYKEGSWSSVVTDDSFQAVTNVTASGNYTKVGRVITCYFSITFGASSSIGASNVFRFSLPFAPAVGGGLSISQTTNVGTMLGGFISGTTMRCQRPADGGGSFTYRGSFSYM